MKKETIKQIILTADEGMYLTNGDTYGKTVVLPEDADQSIWYEISEAEYNEIQEAVT
ncbi:MAG: hypothetical protein IKJ93_00795 [Clostridia bacterium]|nr:hypothetical protein [Clostridia bacterium]